MDGMGQILLSASAYALVIALGYALKRFKFAKPDDYRLIMKIVLNITMPCAVIVNFSQFDFTVSLLIATLLGFSCNLLLWLAGALLSGRDVQKRVLYTLNFPGYNIGSFTMPYVQGFLGPVGVIVTCLFDAGNAIMCTGGSYALTSRFAHGASQGGGVLAVVKKLFSSTPFCTYLFMLLYSLLGFKVPDVVLPLARLVGNANGFLAMLMVGMMFEWSPEKAFLKESVKVLAVRFIAACAFACIFYFLLPLGPEIRKTLAIIVFAPCSAMSPAFTEKCEGNTALSSFTGSLSILISILCMTTLITVLP